MATQESWVNFQEVKKAVSIEQVLDRYNVRVLPANRPRRRGDCPLPTHTSGTKHSFSVDAEKGVWSCVATSCIAARGGKKGGNVIDLVAQMEKCSARDAVIKLKAWFEI